MSVVQLKINERVHELTIKEFNGQRVVTLKEIDELHERSEGTAGRNLRENRKRFVKDEDYFEVSYEQIRATNIVERPNSQGLILITESGYLMLVKSFQDDLAWEVQRQLVNSYFKFKKEQPQQIMSIEEMIILQAESVKDLKQKVDHQEYELGKMKLVVDNDVWITEPQKREIQKSVNRRARQLNDEGYTDVHYQGVYGALKTHFCVAKYDKIPRKDFETAMKLIAGWYPPKKQRTMGI